MISFEYKKNKNPVNQQFTGFFVVIWNHLAEKEGFEPPEV